MIDQQSALIYTMVIVSASDNDMTDAELLIIGDDVKHLPIFRDFDDDKLTQTLKDCATLLGRERGLDEAFRKIKAALTPRLRETAYALACDVAAADGEATQEELRVLELIRDRLEIDRLVAAAMERSARARFATA